MASHNDTLFEPQYGDSFDFTLRFEHIVFSILPVIIVVAAFPALFCNYTRQPVVVAWGWPLYAKLASAVILLGIEVANLVLWAHQPPRHYSSLAIIASSFSCVAMCCMINFLPVEHRHSLQPSLPFSIYLTIDVLLYATKARSCFSRGGALDANGSLLVVAAAFKGLIVLLEEIPKRPYSLSKEHKSCGSETSSGFWNRSMFMWLNKTLFLGYRKALDVKDLEPLDPRFSAIYLSGMFAAVWNKTKKPKKTASSHRLMKALLRCLYRPLCAIIIPRLCHTVFIFSQPLLLRRVVSYVDAREPSVNQARGLVGATILVYLGIAISRAIYTRLSYRLVTLARGVLVSQILEKSFRIEYSVAIEKSSLSLMSTDIEALVTGLPNLHETWICFLEVGLGIYLLTTEVRRAAFLVVIPMIVSTAVSLVIGKRIIRTRKAWNDKIQHRVSRTATVLKHIKAIKMLSIDSSVLTYIQGLRVAEIEQSKPFRLLSLMIPTAATFAYVATPVIVIGGAIFWATAFTERFNAVEAFTSLSIIALISGPLMNIMSSYSNFNSSLACVQRIQDFLLLEERYDRRTPLAPAVRMYDVTDASGSTYTLPTTIPPDQRGINISCQHLNIKSLNGSHLLKNASFDIRQSTLTLITGPVASGKSVLLRAFLGETHIDGVIQRYPVDGAIAYCGQVPWIRNISIRQNILGEHPFDQVWYEKVLDACLLTKDLLQFLNGDGTLAGSDGASLSGGQKSRIALARAVYSCAPLMILDDVFSSLDATTSAAITSNLLQSNGLLRDKRTTVIMTSHSVAHAALADKILFLDGAGNIEAMAAPRSPSATTTNSIITALQYSRTALPSVDDIHRAEDGKKNSLGAQAEALIDIKVQDDHTRRRKGDLALYAFYFRSTKAWMVFLWMMLLIFSTLTQITPSIYIRMWLELGPDNNRYFIGYAALAFSACWSVAVMFWFFYYYVLPDSSNNLHKMLLESVMGATLSFLTETDGGAILNRFSQDISLISQDLPRALLLFIYVGVISIVTTAVVLSGAPYAASTLPVILLMMYIVQHFYLRTSRQIRFLDLEAKTPLYTYISEMATGLYCVRASGMSDKILATGFDLFDISQRPFYYMFCLQRWLTLTMDLAALGIATTVVAFGVLLQHSTSQTALGLSLVNLVLLGESFSNVIQKWTSLETSLGAISRVQSFLKQTPQESEAREITVPPPNWPHAGHIIMNNVTAAYSSTDVPKPVLDNVSLEIYPGQSVVLLGRTGSGKSSLILALLNFFDHSGSIYIDGVNIAKMKRQVLRSQITTITQDPVELDGTLRYNLLFFKLETPENHQTSYDSDAVEVLRRVRLWDYIESRGGLDAQLSDLELSSGQKQLIGIARAVLHNQITGTKVVLMDEPTSNLDLETDMYIQKEIFTSFFSRCTIFTVAHRLETIRHADVSLVVEMAEGTIIRASEPRGSLGFSSGLC